MRGKLELRHQMIEQKESRIAKLESELTESRKESTERLESVRLSRLNIGGEKRGGESNSRGRGKTARKRGSG